MFYPFFLHPSLLFFLLPSCYGLAIAVSPKGSFPGGLTPSVAWLREGPTFKMQGLMEGPWEHHPQERIMVILWSRPVLTRVACYKGRRAKLASSGFCSSSLCFSVILWPHLGRGSTEAKQMGYPNLGLSVPPTVAQVILIKELVSVVLWRPHTIDSCTSHWKPHFQCLLHAAFFARLF